jgi:hypothetical protein
MDLVDLAFPDLALEFHAVYLSVMSRKDKKAAAEYAQQWAEQNREKKREHARRWREKNPDYHREYHRRWTEKNRALTTAYKAERGCQRCGEKDPVVLDFPHVGGKESEVASMVSRKWERILAEIEKCIVVCANCHRRIHHEEEVGGQP